MDRPTLKTRRIPRPRLARHESDNARQGTLAPLGLAGVVLMVLVAPLGCETTTSRQGESRILAGYNFATVEADLPDRARPQAVVAAGEAALRHRGYSVSSSQSTADSGSVEGKPPHGGFFAGSTEVWVRLGAYGTRVGVKVGLLGDEVESRAILDDMLARLGL